MEQHEDTLTMATGKPPQADHPQVFCPEQLLNRCLGKVDFAQRILDRFLTCFPADLQALEQAYHAGDPACIARLAHRLKGGAASITANRLHPLVAEVEKRIRDQGVVDSIDELMKHVNEEALLLIEVLKQWRDRSPSAWSATAEWQSRTPNQTGEQI